jgi:hypothetical protein
MQQTPESTLIWLAAIGAALGLGQLLKSKEPVTIRSALGRAIVTAGLSMSGSLILLFYPNAPFIACLGAGAFVGSIGTDMVVAILKKYVAK